MSTMFRAELSGCCEVAMISNGPLDLVPTTWTAPEPAVLPAETRNLLAHAFGVAMTYLDGDTGDVLAASSDQPEIDWDARSELCRATSRRGRPELLDEEDPLVVLAVPLGGESLDSPVAAGLFVSRQLGPKENFGRAAAALGLDREEVEAWARQQTPWSPESLLRTAQLVIAQFQARQRIKQLEEEAGTLSVHLSSTYEEISLLHRLTQNLKLSEGDEDLGRAALEWMEDVLPAAGLAIQLVPGSHPDASPSLRSRHEPVLLTYGRCLIENAAFTRLVEHLRPETASRPIVVNPPVTVEDDWPCSDVRQLILVPVAEGEHLFGWLAAINHVSDGEFGSVEANLLASVAAILGIHSGNIELYRQQSDLMASIVRALTSAIDAKDPYTRGHSNRVARVAVRLAEDLRCDAATLGTIYLSGLLHDIGKIGVDDQVLRKPGQLSEKEYEHIKKHVEIGHRILRDLRRLENVLPAILHHHESWDGTGYPNGLAAKEIPLAARIVAVADAFDAMSSNRPYRPGMPDEKIDEIFHRGSGQQWDAQVVAAFFRVREDVRRIAREEEEEARQCEAMIEAGNWG
jgi:putative nucleotidyltransferase with HDIG domain